MILRLPIGAFLLSPDTIKAMESLCDDRMFFHSRIEIREGGLDAAVPFLTDKKTPTLLIVEVGDTNGDALLDKLDQLAGVCDPDTRLILIGSVNDIELYRTLTDSGVSDYLLQPVDELKLKTSIAQVFSAQEPTSGGKVLSFFGVSGGVGSSTIAHNVAHRMATEQDLRVTLIDLDMHFGTAALNLNIEPRLTLVDAIAQFSNLNQEVFTQLTTAYDDNLLVVASPASLNVGLQLELQVVEGLVREARAMSDVVILDIPHGWDNMTDDVIALCDDLVLVARPDLTGLRNAKSLVETLGPKRKVDATTRLVLNQVANLKNAEVSDKDFGNALAITPEAIIPMDGAACGQALNDGSLVTQSHAKSAAAKAIMQLADQISPSSDKNAAFGRTDAGASKADSFLSRLFKGSKSKSKD